MSTAALRRPLTTFEEFCALIPEGQKADLIDGVIYMASPDNIEGNDLYAWLYALMSFFIDAKELGGKLNISRVAYRLSPRTGPEPDIGYIGPEKLDKVRHGYIDAAPDLAIEIVSEDSVTRDYELKRTAYEKAGVREYWIIDPLEEKVTLLRLSRDGVFKQVRPRAGRFVSKVIDGFWFDPAWFWRQPLPSKIKILATVLDEKGMDK